MTAGKSKPQPPRSCCPLVAACQEAACGCLAYPPLPPNPNPGFCWCLLSPLPIHLFLFGCFVISIPGLYPASPSLFGTLPS